MKLDLAYYGDPILRKKATPVEKVDEELRQLIHNMEETMFETNGIGLAAPQVHRSLRVFIINIPEKDAEGEYQPTRTWVFINPKILELSDETWDAQEGCLSIPRIYEDVTRPLRVKIEAKDANGILFTQEFSGWEAKAILHENDHINGVLFIDRLHGKKRKALDPLLNDIKRRYYLKKL